MAENGKSEKDEKMRVKLYMLNACRVWDDQGTGYVSSTFIEKTKSMFLLVKEENRNTVLLESKIQLNTAYQKQQETLIVWSEADNYDYALSFQNKAGCDEIWEQICQVQGKDPSVDITQEIIDQDGDDLDDEHFDTVQDTTMSLVLPPCEISRLDEISDLFNASLVTPIKREKLANLIESESYIKKLLDLFHMSEDLDNIESLHQLYGIFKSMFFLNKTALFEVMFTDELIFDVIGVLEYDPSLAKPARHREYLRTQTKLKEVIPLNNWELVQKIHQTYRVQYIQDVILPTPSVFEENLLSTLSSFIYFNKMEIVTVLQEDGKYLQSLFRQLTDDETEDSTRKDMVFFLKEFCAFSQTLAQPNREGFFKTLSNLGILNVVEFILGLDDVSLKAAAIDIFSYVVEFSPSMVREFVLQESLKQDDEDLLINMVIEQMITDSDPELGAALQLMGIIRLLIDPENMITTIKTEKSEFLVFFYAHCMHVLTAPLFANTANERPSKDDYQTAQLMAHILELLTFCVEHHTYHVKTYLISKHLIRRILVLLRSRHAFLMLASLRLLRRTIGLKDEFYNKHIIKCDLLKPVADAFAANGHKYNLFNSAVIELFEFIKTEDMRSLIAYFIKNHFSAFESVTYVKTFQVLKEKYEQQQERQHNMSSDSSDLLTLSMAIRRDPRGLDEDEENWFDQDDDFDDVDLNPKVDLSKKLDLDYEPLGGRMLPTNKSALNVSSQARTSPPARCKGSISINIVGSTISQQSPTFTPANSPSASPIKPSSPPQPGKVAVNAKTPSLMGLVEYSDEEDEEDEEEKESEEDETLPAAKRPRLST